MTPDLYSRVIPASAQAEASNISYHTIQTFPERGFGYVELSQMEADKVKKKLNGMTLKGTKVRVEEARPEKKRKAGREEEGEDERQARKRAKKEKKKQKREEGVIPGHELEEGRHVKRGWTDEKSKRKDKEGKKMKFKTSVPPNAMPVEEPSKTRAKSKEKKEKKQSKTQKVVQEFSKSKKPTSLASVVENETPAHYEEGKGWVNEDGEVVEAEHAGKKRRREAEKARKAAEEAEAKVRELEESAKKPADSVVDDASDSESVSSVSEDSPSESSVSEDEDQDEEIPGAPPAAPSTPPRADSPKSQSPSPNSILNSTTAQSEPGADDATREVHPLEALYKRKPNITPINTSFSFFNPDDNASVTSDTGPGQTITVPPQTPHTKQDLEWRGMRSAAPTPDTAAIGKRFSFALPDDVEEEDDEEEDRPVLEKDGGPTIDTGKREESAFRKWFYEHRGENNRAWKKKRREAKKVQRQRENRRVSRRIV